MPRTLVSRLSPECNSLGGIGSLHSDLLAAAAVSGSLGLFDGDLHLISAPLDALLYAMGEGLLFVICDQMISNNICSLIKVSPKEAVGGSLIFSTPS